MGLIQCFSRARSVLRAASKLDGAAIAGSGERRGDTRLQESLITSLCVAERCVARY
jgi:hypothetical protein